MIHSDRCTLKTGEICKDFFAHRIPLEKSDAVGPYQMLVLHQMLLLVIIVTTIIPLLSRMYVCAWACCMPSHLEKDKHKFTSF